MSIHQKSNGTWFVQFRVPGEQKIRREYCGVGPAGEERARIRDHEIKELKSRGQRLAADKVYLDELAQAYLTERKLSGKSRQWLGEMETLFNEKILPELCFCPVDELRYPDVIRMAAKAWPEVKLATRQRYLGYLKAAFN